MAVPAFDISYVPQHLIHLTSGMCEGLVTDQTMDGLGLTHGDGHPLTPAEAQLIGEVEVQVGAMRLFLPYAAALAAPGQAPIKVLLPQCEHPYREAGTGDDAHLDADVPDRLEALEGAARDAHLLGSLLERFGGTATVCLDEESGGEHAFHTTLGVVPIDAVLAAGIATLGQWQQYLATGSLPVELADA